MITAVMLLSSVLTLVSAAASFQIRGVDGALLHPFDPAGSANVLFFISVDCPISNSYAPEIQRLCERYAKQGVGCVLMYEDPDLSAGTARRHLQEYGYKGIPAAIDAERKVSSRAKADVTPEAVVVDQKGEIRYRGRIDNFYADFGKPRQQVTVHDLSDALDAVLAGHAVANPETQALGCTIVDPRLLRKQK
jgi:DNA-binding transcriptional LysR family regulator